MRHRIKPEHAEMGMYVKGFAGKWTSHPFWRARFVIASEQDLARIRAGAVDIFIDPAKGVAPSVAPSPAPRPADADVASSVQGVAPRGRPAMAFAPVPPLQPRRSAPPRRLIAPPTFGKADKARAIALAQRSTKVVKAMFDDCRLGRTITAEQILSVVQDIAGTLEQNSAAFASVTRLKSKDDGTYTHSVAVCALMISLAREAGLSATEVHDLGTAGLLHDIGKVMIDDAILQKVEPLTALERARIERHPELGHAILVEEPGLPAVALDACLHHHERLDGSGYPFGLSGDQLSRAARMAAICDVYDAMTSDRPYKKGISPIDAITWMDAAGDRFDSDLLFRFMRSIGVYPVGKLVRLRSNQLAIIMPPKTPNSRPIARAFYTTIGNHFTPPHDTILGDALNEDNAIRAEDAMIWFSDSWQAMVLGISSGAHLSDTTQPLFA